MPRLFIYFIFIYLSFFLWLKSLSFVSHALFLSPFHVYRGLTNPSGACEALYSTPVENAFFCCQPKKVSIK